MLHSRMFVMAASVALLVGAGMPGTAHADRGAFSSTADGTVFFPNPVQQLGREDLELLLS